MAMMSGSCPLNDEGVLRGLSIWSQNGHGRHCASEHVLRDYVRDEATAVAVWHLLDLEQHFEAL